MGEINIMTMYNGIVIYLSSFSCKWHLAPQRYAIHGAASRTSRTQRQLPFDIFEARRDN